MVRKKITIERTHLLVYALLPLLLLGAVSTALSIEGQPRKISMSGSIDYSSTPPTDPPPAADITVPDDYATIQQAINNAHNGYVIHVRAGTYAGFSLKSLDDITIYGDAPAPVGAANFHRHIVYGEPLNYPTTIIDGDLGLGIPTSGIIINARGCDRLRMFNFVIRNSGPWADGEDGSAISLGDNSDIADYVELYSLVIHTIEGRGISWVQDSPLSVGNIIHDNLLYNVGYAAGFQAGRAISMSRTNGEVYNNWLTGGKLSEFGAAPFDGNYGGPPGERGIGEGGVNSASHWEGRPLPTYIYVHHNLFENHGGVPIEMSAADNATVRCEYNHITNGATNTGNSNAFYIHWYAGSGTKTFIGNIIHWHKEDDIYFGAGYSHISGSGNIFAAVGGAHRLPSGWGEYRANDAGLPKTPWGNLA